MQTSLFLHEKEEVEEEEDAAMSESRTPMKGQIPRRTRLWSRWKRKKKSLFNILAFNSVSKYGLIALCHIPSPLLGPVRKQELQRPELPCLGHNLQR